MTTPVEFYFVTPTGEPISNALVEVQPAKSGYSGEVNGVVMPRHVEAITDANGRVTIGLWPSTIPYCVRCSDTLSEAEIFYNFVVPAESSNEVLRLQDLIVGD